MRPDECLWTEWVHKQFRWLHLSIKQATTHSCILVPREKMGTSLVLFLEVSMSLDDMSLDDPIKFKH